MADDKNQRPEESFKEKILRSLQEQNDGSANDSGRSEKQENLNQFDSEHKKQTELSDTNHRDTRRSLENHSVSDENQPLDNRRMRSVPRDTQFDDPKLSDISPNLTSQQTEEIHASEESSSVGSRTAHNHGNSAENSSENVPVVQDDDPNNKKKNVRKKEDRLVRKIVLIVISTLVVIGGILAFSLYRYVSSSLEPLDPKDSQLVQVDIPSGSSNKAIGEILEKDKIVKSGMVFNFYTKFNNITDFQSGYYQMSPDMTLNKICKLLQEGGTAEPVDIADAKVTIPEGYDITQIATQIEKASKKKLKADDFIALMKNDDFFNKMLAKYPQLLTSASQAKNVRYRLEGYLFPATYDYYKKTSTVENLAEQMIAKADSVMANYYEQIQNSGSTVHQVLTLASLVEKEGVKESDRKNIAQVFLNRLNANMPLQSDISILYALNTHKETVTYDDLEVDSPYNLYKNTGYGPGPFNSPSEASITAVLSPTENNYFYFVADISTGKVYFAETYEEHEKLVEKYVNN